ncbi:MAG: ATP phosphoribosyltransferase regulatory subunit [Candidatus Daviesbacteria bacterium]|nr:ATP phosphoribosyltransferase regulatory subunit [Candidatus Daviesbacteria bacterium]
MIKAPPTPKGFRDIKPDLAKRRRETINQIVSVLEESGFEPIETPTIEFAETLTGKYGEEERLIYKFTDRGGRELALRYDLTVPLARYVATYNPPMPFRRYQIGQVFRGENPQKGRWREFTQFDFDTVGSSDIEDDANVIAAVIAVTKKLGMNQAIMLINDRKNFSTIPIDVIRAYDKLSKIGQDGVDQEILGKGFSKEEIERFKSEMSDTKKKEALEPLFAKLKEKGLVENQDFMYDSTLARGLDYYTGSIFELKSNSDPKSLSIGAGGRYDNLIGSFSKKEIPAVGFSFGLDRLIETLN